MRLQSSLMCLLFAVGCTGELKGGLDEEVVPSPAPRIATKPAPKTPEATPTPAPAPPTTTVTPVPPLAPVVMDAGTTTPPAPPTMAADAGTPVVPVGSSALRVVGNRIVKADGTRWHGRGANLNDMRSCNACTGGAPSVAEVKRRIDELVDVWKVNFIRLDLESYAQSDGYRHASNYQSVLYDPQYLADVRELVRYIGTKPGVQVLVSLWHDPSIDALGRPTINSTIGTDATWRKLAQALADQPHAMFGIINEPQANYDGSADALVHSLMSQVVRAIRETEEAANVPYHIVTVQGTGGWARRLDYYATHPITERGGANIAYEVHVYDPVSSFGTLFERFASTLPIIIGEFGPMTGSMTQADCTTLMDRAQALEIPHLAWTFHMRCAPSLFVDTTNGGCGIGTPLTPTAWGNQLKARLATPW